MRRCSNPSRWSAMPVPTADSIAEPQPASTRTRRIFFPEREDDGAMFSSKRILRIVQLAELAKYVSILKVK